MFRTTHMNKQEVGPVGPTWRRYASAAETSRSLRWSLSPPPVSPAASVPGRASGLPGLETAACSVVPRGPVRETGRALTVLDRLSVYSHHGVQPGEEWLVIIIIVKKKRVRVQTEASAGQQNHRITTRTRTTEPQNHNQNHRTRTTENVFSQTRLHSRVQPLH